MSSVSTYSVGKLALLAAMGMVAVNVAPAAAADLGGDCCADLEERIAELEATTARKGNRKVKLEISGHVNQMVMWWDDGTESNAYIVTNDNARSRFRFKGEAKIDADWKAGYLIEIGVRAANSKRTNQDDDNGADSNLLDLRHNYWYLDSKTYGRVSVGLTGGASEGVTEVNLAATKDIAKYSDVEDSGLGMGMLSNGTRLTTTSSGAPILYEWRRLLRDGGDQPGEGRRHNLVKYDTPEFAGFKGTANWGEDDTWEVGLGYKGEFSGFKLAAAIAYGENKDGTGQTGFQCPGAVAGVNDRECSQLGGSLSVMHEATGIYVNFASGYLEDDVILTETTVPAALREDRSYFYAGELGIEQKWNALGKTTLFVQYFKNEGGTLDREVRIGGVPGSTPPVLGASFGDVQESELEAFGAGVIQGIDAAAMHLYLTYRHYEGDITANNAGAVTNFDLDDLDVVMGGAIIRF